MRGGGGFKKIKECWSRTKREKWEAEGAAAAAAPHRLSSPMGEDIHDTHLQPPRLYFGWKEKKKKN
jgi:hypothetical protein